MSCQRSFLAKTNKITAQHAAENTITFKPGIRHSVTEADELIKDAPRNCISPNFGRTVLRRLLCSEGPPIFRKKSK